MTTQLTSGFPVSGPVSATPGEPRTALMPEASAPPCAYDAPHEASPVPGRPGDCHDGQGPVSATGAGVEGSLSTCGTAEGWLLIERLVRRPAEFVASLEGRDLNSQVRALLGAVFAGAGVFGAVVGGYRGGAQVAYCAVKVPLVLVATLVICTPAFVSIARATGTPLPARAVVVLTLGACARFAAVLAGVAPVLWLCQGWLDYHPNVLATVAACAFAGVVAASLLLRGLVQRGGGLRGLVAGAAFASVFGIVGLQTSWLLRPYLVRPQTVHVPFVRPLESDVAESTWKTTRSAAGIYDRRACEGGPCD